MIKHNYTGLSSSTCRPQKRTYQRKKPPSSILGVRKRKPVEIAFVSPDIISSASSAPSPVSSTSPPVLPVSLVSSPPRLNKVERLSSIKNPPKLNNTLELNDSVHVKHTSNDAFDQLLNGFK